MAIKLTETKLRQIIREEMRTLTKESDDGSYGYDQDPYFHRAKDPLLKPEIHQVAKVMSRYLVVPGQGPMSARMRRPVTADDIADAFPELELDEITPEYVEQVKRAMSGR